METAICRICNEEKFIFEFRLSGKYRRKECKSCEKEKSYKYFLENKEKMADYNKKHYLENRDEALKYAKQYRQMNIEKVRNNSREYYQNNKEYFKNKSKEYYETNKDKINADHKLWLNNNKDKVKKYRAKETTKRKQNPILKLELQLRNRIRESFTKHKYKKNLKLELITGLDVHSLRNHLIETFKSNYGYDWDRIEKVHIDHIKPLKNAKTEEDVIKLCHYSNLQLLKADDNLKKGAKEYWHLNN